MIAFSFTKKVGNKVVINHGGALRKEYFISYLTLVMNTMQCPVEQAKEVTFQRLFRNDTKTLGKESYRQFLLAYEELR
ncbi:hypothetical protein [Oceanobacillus damuensis]|uniref:hypothetical protein n=1 Tax=Oceanobacillus damuensis TaxID=937928 RepID=UPI000A52FB74|nr:hypothetical protein [Oceanobacillus damuensis]